MLSTISIIDLVYKVCTYLQHLLQDMVNKDEGRYWERLCYYASVYACAEWQHTVMCLCVCLSVYVLLL